MGGGRQWNKDEQKNKLHPYQQQYMYKQSAGEKEVFATSVNIIASRGIKPVCHQLLSTKKKNTHKKHIFSWDSIGLTCWKYILHLCGLNGKEDGCRRWWPCCVDEGGASSCTEGLWLWQQLSPMEIAARGGVGGHVKMTGPTAGSAHAHNPHLHQLLYLGCDGWVR